MGRCILLSSEVFRKQEMKKETDNIRNSKGQFTKGNTEGNRWKKGESGNPNGRRNSFTDLLNEIGDQEKDDRSKRFKIMSKLYAMAEKGDLNAIKFIVERIEGKAVETIRTQEVEPIKILDLDEEYE